MKDRIVKALAEAPGQAMHVDDLMKAVGTSECDLDIVRAGEYGDAIVELEETNKIEYLYGKFIWRLAK